MKGGITDIAQTKTARNEEEFLELAKELRAKIKTDTWFDASSRKTFYDRYFIHEDIAYIWREVL